MTAAIVIFGTAIAAALLYGAARLGDRPPPDTGPLFGAGLTVTAVEGFEPPEVHHDEYAQAGRPGQPGNNGSLGAGLAGHPWGIQAPVAAPHAPMPPHDETVWPTRPAWLAPIEHVRAVLAACPGDTTAEFEAIIDGVKAGA